jgi:hypothetical protein
MRVSVKMWLFLVVVSCVAAILGPARAVAQVPVIVGAVGCDARGQRIGFPVAQDGLIQSDDLPPAALGVLDPRVVVTCQAAFEAVDAAGDGSFALAPGSVTFTVSGPAVIVESGSQSYSVACGEPGVAGSCTGATAPSEDSRMAGGTDALTVHVALMPGAALPAPPVAGAFALQATYISAISAGGVLTAAAGTPIDLAAPAYRLVLSSDRSVIRSGAGESVNLTAQLWHTVPGACAQLGEGPYLVCNSVIAAPGAVGAEPGTITFTTDLGEFVGFAESIQAPCGDPNMTGGPLVVPPAGSDYPFKQSCEAAAVKLSPFGHGGDANVTATFSGAVTGAGADDHITVAVAPEPATLRLRRGCTPLFVPSGFPAGSPVSLLVESVTPSAAVSSVWRQEPLTGRWQAGYLLDAEAPLDFTTLRPGDQVTVCIATQARFPLG